MQIAIAAVAFVGMFVAFVVLPGRLLGRARPDED